MAVANLLEGIEVSTDTLRAVLKDKRKYNDEKGVLWLEEKRYNAYYQQIHSYLAPKRTDKGEKEIREHIRTIITIDLVVCKQKLDRFFNAIPIYEKRKDTKNQMLAFEYFQKWRALYEQFYALASFRSLEHFAIFMEWDKPFADKMWEHSIDTFNDGGYSGCTKGFFYYANKMVLTDEVNFILKQLPTAYGKCGLPSTSVRTAQGVKRLGEVEVGDYVYSMQDRKAVLNKVLNVWNSKKKQVKITTNSGTEITVSPEHHLYTQNGYVSAEKICVDDYLYRLCTPIDNGIEQDENELAFATLMMFDGHCSHPNMSFTKQDSEILEKFKTVCKNLGFEYCQTKKNNAWQIRILSNGGKPQKILEKYGLYGENSKDKKLSNVFLSLPLKQRYDFIGYMLATDGYIPKTKSLAGICLSSKELIVGIQRLLNSCGIYSYFSKRKTNCNGKEFDCFALSIPHEYLHIVKENCYCYQKQKDLIDKVNNLKDTESLSVTYPKEIVQDCHEFKRLVNKQFARNISFKRSIVEKFNQETRLLEDIVYKDFVFERIKSVEFIDETVDMVDIEVENAHNFVANDIVSHNSYSDSIMIAFIFGKDKNEQIIKVVGNNSLPPKCTLQVVNIMASKRYLQVFPEYAKLYSGTGDIKDQIFSVCRIKDGMLTIQGSSKDTNYECFSKECKRDGVRCGYLFLDDVVQKKEMLKLDKHKEDLADFDGTWKKRCRDEFHFKIVVGGTTYDAYDLLCELKFRYSGGKLYPSKVNKWTHTNKEGTSAFICVPKLDEHDKLTFPQKCKLETVLADRKNNPDIFYAMDMQQPTVPKEYTFYWDYLLQYDYIPSDCTDYCLAVLDPARSGKNYVSMPICRKRQEVLADGTTIERHYLTGCFYQKVPMDEAYGKICDLIEEKHIVKLLIERNTDTSLKYVLDKMLHERGVMFCEINEVYSTKKKEDRIYADETLIKNSIVYPRRDMYSVGSEMGLFMNHIISYKYSGSDYDDSIDSIGLYCDEYVAQKNGKAKAKVLYV